MELDQNWNERKAIQLRMQQLQEESKAIRIEYERLFNRLRELDSLHKNISNSQEVENINNKDATKTQKSKESQIEINTPKEENDDIFSKIEEIRRSISGKAPDSSILLPNMIDQKQNEAILDGEITKIETAPNTSKKIATAAEILSNPPSRNKSQYKDYIILTHLKSKKMLKTAQVKEILTENALDIKNTTVVLKVLMEKYPEITKVGHGMYKWVEL